MKTWQIILLVLACCGIIAAVWRQAQRARHARQSTQQRTPDAPTAPPAPAQATHAAEHSEHSPEPAVLPSYNPSKVGNDSAARLWDSAPANVAAAVETEIEHEAQALTEQDALIAQLRYCFIDMQRAWDNADIARLRAMLTQDMLDLLNERLLERENQGASVHPAEIMVLEARLLNQEQSDTHWSASVEFSGMVRESPAQAPTPFREIWDLVQARHAADTRWLVASVQSLQ